MRFQTSASYLEGETDIDPIASPGTILSKHVLVLPEAKTPCPATALWLALIGEPAETLTLSLYLLVDETNHIESVERFVNVGHVWFPIATGVVVTHGTLLAHTSGIPAGGVVYARRTADAITAAQTRNLVAAWV